MIELEGDYSCGNCGWIGYSEQCDDNNNCPLCGSEQTGEITDKDFEEGNALNALLNQIKY